MGGRKKRSEVRLKKAGIAGTGAVAGWWYCGNIAKLINAGGRCKQSEQSSQQGPELIAVFFSESSEWAEFERAEVESCIMELCSAADDIKSSPWQGLSSEENSTGAAGCPSICADMAALLTRLTNRHTLKIIAIFIASDSSTYCRGFAINERGPIPNE